MRYHAVFSISIESFFQRVCKMLYMCNLHKQASLQEKERIGEIKEKNEILHQFCRILFVNCQNKAEMPSM